ncbi:MAG: DUF4007 family protein [Thermoflexales bacterium]|nr:DUF4007 family protein [Thermoflexales bacterium]
MPYAKHESFHIREGWLAKGLRAVQAKRDILRNDTEAAIQLGLGRNMVRALQFWLTATGLIHPEPPGHSLTPFGSLVLEHDPYFEDIGTLWLVQYHLASSRDEATTWYWFFNHFAYPEFDQETFIQELSRWALTHEERKPLARRTLETEFQVLIRTYVPSGRETSPEDAMDSPLTELGLLETLSGRRYRMCSPDPNPDRLPPLIVLYVLLQERPGVERRESQIGLAQALRDPFGVGRVFNLGAAALLESLDHLASQTPEWAVRLTRTGGLDRLTLPLVAPREVLARYYRERGYDSRSA